MKVLSGPYLTDPRAMIRVEAVDVAIDRASGRFAITRRNRPECLGFYEVALGDGTRDRVPAIAVPILNDPGVRWRVRPVAQWFAFSRATDDETLRGRVHGVLPDGEGQLHDAYVEHVVEGALAALKEAAGDE